MPEWNPFWTDMAKIESGGRYPLLLNRFHDHMEDLLIKGIVSTTHRLRYISNCCWAIGDIENKEKCSEYYSFVEAFRRRESALAIGYYLLKPKSSLGQYPIYGTEVLRVRVTNEDIDYDCSFKILPSQELGAFGQYYKGTMQNWGLIYTDENSVIKLTDSGNELYEIMDNHYKNSDYHKSYRGKKKVPGRALMDWGKLNEYDNIRDSHHKKERNFYKNILFHLNIKTVEDYRRDTLVSYLESIIECNNKGISFNEDVLRNIFYYYKIKQGEKIIDINLSPFLNNAIFFWKIYEIHVYFRWWISEFFRFFLYKLNNSSEGLKLDEVFSDFNVEKFNLKINEIIGIKKDWYSLTFEEIHKSISNINKLKIDFLEERLTYSEIEDFSHVSAYLIAMLILLLDKYKSINNDSRYLEVRMTLTDDFWFDELFRYLEGMGEVKNSDLLNNISKRFVLDKHDKRMYAKGDLRRCWFTKSGDKYIHQADTHSIWRLAKHNIIINFLFDMKLIDIKDDKIIVSDEGVELYNFLKGNIYYG